MNLEKYFAYVGTVDRAVEATAVPYQQNKESIGDCQENKQYI